MVTEESDPGAGEGELDPGFWACEKKCKADYHNERSARIICRGKCFVDYVLRRSESGA